MAFLLFIIFILALLISKSLYKAWINPIGLFVCIFMLAFFSLFSVDYISLELLDGKLSLLYFISILFYLVGIVLGYRKHSKRKKLNSLRGEDDNRIYSKEIHILFFIVFVFTLLHWANSFSRYGLLGLFSSLIVTKAEDMDTNNIYLQFSMISMLLSPYTLYYILKYKKWASAYTFILLFTFLANLSYSRATLFWILFLDLFVIVYHYQSQEKKIGFKVPFFLGLAVLLFGSYFSSTQEMLGKASEITGSFLGVPMSSNITTMVTYLVGPLVSPFHYLGDNVDVPVFGFTLRILYDHLSPLGININSDTYMPVEFVPIPFDFNTTSIQYYIFREGGWLWTIVFFSFLGYIADKAYWTFKIMQNRFSLMWLCLLSLLLVMSIRSYLLTFLNILIFIIVLLFLQSLNLFKRIYH